MLHLCHRALLEYPGTGATRSRGKGWRNQARIGLAVIGAQRGTDGDVTDPREALAQLGAIKQLQIQVKALAGLGIGDQFGHVGVAACQLQMAAALVFAVDAQQGL